MLYVRAGYGYGNIGDDAILLSIEQREGKVCYLADHRSFGQIVTDAYGIEFKIYPSDLQGTEKIAFGGGTLINAHAFPDNHYCRQALVCIDKGCEVVWYGIGIDSINDPALVREAMERSAGITVRDAQSEQLLRKIGVSKAIDIVGDPAESWNIPTQGTNPDSRLLGVNLTSVEGYTLENCVRMIQSVLAATDFEILLYPFSRHVIDPTQDDSLLLNKLLVELNNGRVHLYSGPHHPVDILESMKNLGAFIGSRFHSVVFSHKLGLATIGLSGMSKSRRFLGQHGYPAFDIANTDQVRMLTGALTDIAAGRQAQISSPIEHRTEKDARIFYLKEQTGRSRQKIAELQNRLKESATILERKMQESESRIQDSKAAFERKMQDSEATYERRIQESAKLQGRLHREIGQLQARLTESEAAAELRLQRIAQLQGKLNKSEETIQQRQREFGQLQANLNEALTVIAGIQDSILFELIQYMRRMVRLGFHPGSRRHKLWIKTRKCLAIWFREGLRSLVKKIIKKMRHTSPEALPESLIAKPQGPETTAIAIQNGAAKEPKVLINIDYPSGDSQNPSQISGIIDINGWAIADKGISQVLVYCDDVLQGVAGYGSNRIDVAKVYPNRLNAESSGYHFIWDSSKMTNDVHTLKIAALGTDGDSAELTVCIIVKNSHTAYDRWQELNKISPSAIRWMKSCQREFGHPSGVSLLLVKQTQDFTALHSTLDSLRSQAYPEWELSIACNAKLYETIRPQLAEIIQSEPRIKVLADDFDSKAEAWNRLLEQSSKEMIGLIDEGDQLQPQALFEMVYQFNQNEELDLAYSDEDILLDSGRRDRPVFKPGWSPDLLLSRNYIGRFWMSFRSLVKDAGGFRKEDEQACEYGLLLRLTEKARKIGSVKTILYNRRTENVHPDSPKTEAALRQALSRRAVKGRVEAGPLAGTYRVKRDIEGKPLISIIIPTRGNLQFLRPCLESIVAKSSYSNYEIIIVDNNDSLPNETQEYYNSLPHKIIQWHNPFNWSRINNFAAQRSTGDYLLFLNDDTEVISADWMEALLEHAQRREVAAVGAKLLYKNGTVQHAGMFLVDHGGGARHAFRHLQADDPGYLGLAGLQRNCSVITGACLMTRREAFDNLGGFDEQFGITNNDADFCLRALEKGYLMVYTPYALLHHHEKVTRKDISETEDTERYWEKWRSLLERGDHYYNPNLSLESDLLSLNERPLAISYADWPPLDKTEIKNILVIKLDHLGDVILSLPAIRRLKQLFSGAHITVMAGPWSKPFLEHEPGVDRVLTYDGFFSADSAMPPNRLEELDRQEIRERLADYKFDLAIDLRRHPETREFLLLSGARYTAGFANYEEFPWLTIALPYEHDKHMYHPRRHIAQELAALVEFAATGADVHLDAVISDETRQSADNLLKSLAIPNTRPIIGIHPGVGQPIRRWPISSFSRLADLFCERLDASVIVFGTDGEKEMAEKIIEDMEYKGRAFSLAGNVSLKGFLHLLKRCDLFVGNNSGPVHMAAALNVPTVGVYAGTNHPKEWGPIGPRACAIHLEVGCSPCYLMHANTCPYDMACLRLLNPEQVWQASQRMLASGKTSAPK